MDRTPILDDLIMLETYHAGSNHTIKVEWVCVYEHNHRPLEVVKQEQRDVFGDDIVFVETYASLV